MLSKSILFLCTFLTLSNAYAGPKCKELWNQYLQLNETLQPLLEDIINNTTPKPMNQKTEDYRAALAHSFDQTNPLFAEATEEGCEDYFNKKTSSHLKK